MKTASSKHNNISNSGNFEDPSLQTSESKMLVALSLSKAALDLSRNSFAKTMSPTRHLLTRQFGFGAADSLFQGDTKQLIRSFKALTNDFD